jgi:hypothetical protein
MADGCDNNGWIEWRKHVLLEIKRINENLEKMNEKYIVLCVEVAKLKVYAVVWGAAGGSVITALILLAVSRG